MISILLVDDDWDMLDLMQLELSDCKEFSIRICPNPLDALKILKNQEIEIIITDYKMPKMDGGEFVAEARSAGFNGLIIIYSGMGKDSRINSLLNAGADFYIQRSGDPDSEFTYIKKTIHNYQKRKVKKGKTSGPE